MAAHPIAHCPAVERRDELRVPSSARVKIFARGDHADEGVAVDISSGGLCVSLGRPLRAGALHRVLVIHDHPERPQEHSRVGRVCFCLPRNGTYRIGLQLF
jgi:hypothetical protein